MTKKAELKKKAQKEFDKDSDWGDDQTQEYDQEDDHENENDDENEMDENDEEEDEGEDENENDENDDNDEYEEEGDDDEVIIVEKVKEKPKARATPKSRPTKVAPVMRFRTGPVEVQIPRIKGTNPEWKKILDKHRKDMPNDFFDKRFVSLDLNENGNGVYLLAYYCAILNTDPSYLEPYFLADHDGPVNEYFKSGHEEHEEYENFRVVLGVLIARISNYLLHFHLEIAQAMKEGDHGGLSIPDEKMFKIDWDSYSGTWIEGTKFESHFLDERYMKFLSPYNFMYVFWDMFSFFATEVLEMARGPIEEWKAFADYQYEVNSCRYLFFTDPWVRSRVYRWRGWRSDVCLGLARTKTQRESIESGKAPVDYLQESVSGHKLDHYDQRSPADIYDPVRSTWNLQDVFEGSDPDYTYPWPQIEYESEALQGRGGKRKWSTAKGDGSTG